ncbi:hypothetical protein LSAT2_003566, partial [Lamellibrachia satsuma]
YLQIDAKNVDDEFERQDKYLRHYHVRRTPVRPDGNSLFASVRTAGRLDVDSDELRQRTVEYIAGNLNDFNQFMSPDPGRAMLDNMRDIADKLQMMKEDGSWVGYETIMALSRNLGAVILVTSGGSTDNDAVRTDSFYFGEERPEKQIHILWASVGFYDAVLPGLEPELNIYDNADGQQDSRRTLDDKGYLQLVAKPGRRNSNVCELIGEVGRQPRRYPSHICRCKRSCECKRWQQVYTFPEDVVKNPAESCPTTSPCTAWHEVFMHLCNDAHVLRRWKFIMRWLKLSEASLTEIDHEHKTISEKVYAAFETWRTEQTESEATVLVLQQALRKEKLNLAADGLEKYK